MANLKSLRERAQELTVTSALMENRNKGDLSDLYGKSLTIVDFDFLKGDDGEYPIFNVAEDTFNFYFGGKVLHEKLKTLEIDGYKEAIQSEGLPVMFSEKKSKKGKSYTAVQFYPIVID